MQITAIHQAHPRGALFNSLKIPQIFKIKKGDEK